MAGNSQRRGAVRKATKNTAGSGGRRRKGLSGRGPTPKAEDRTYHPAYKKKQETVRKKTPNTGNGRRGGERRRVKDGPELIAGRNSVLEALRAGIPAKALFVSGRMESDDRVTESLKIAADRGLPLMEASKFDLDRMTHDAIHQGIALQIPPYEYADVDELLDIAASAGEPPLLVALDSVTDPRNLGAVMRSVDAFGGHGVIIPQRRSAAMTSGAWKTAAGAGARVRVAQVGNLNNTIDELRRSGVFVLGLDGDGDVSLPKLAQAIDPVCLVVGSEGKGLSRLTRDKCDMIVSIPISDHTESLNASVAAAVSLYEVARQRMLG